MSISQLDSYLQDNPHIQQLPSLVALGDPTRLGLIKPEGGFRDVLKQVKKKNRGSKINTW